MKLRYISNDIEICEMFCICEWIDGRRLKNLAYHSYFCLNYMVRVLKYRMWDSSGLYFESNTEIRFIWIIQYNIIWLEEPLASKRHKHPRAKFSREASFWESLLLVDPGRKAYWICFEMFPRPTIVWREGDCRTFEVFFIGNSCLYNAVIRPLDEMLLDLKHGNK